MHWPIIIDAAKRFSFPWATFRAIKLFIKLTIQLGRKMAQLKLGRAMAK